jgi:hypothetical protein
MRENINPEFAVGYCGIHFDADGVLRLMHEFFCLLKRQKIAG